MFFIGVSDERTVDFGNEKQKLLYGIRILEGSCKYH